MLVVCEWCMNIVSMDVAVEVQANVFMCIDCYEQHTELHSEAVDENENTQPGETS
jgi:hypothetical protein